MHREVNMAFGLRSHPYPLINETNLRICKLALLGRRNEDNAMRVVVALAILAPAGQIASGSTGEPSLKAATPHSSAPSTGKDDASGHPELAHQAATLTPVEAIPVALGGLPHLFII